MQSLDGSFVFSPTDLTAFVACPHLTTLHVAVALEELPKPFRHNPHADLIRRKGEEHEGAYLASLGPDVVRIGKPWEIGWDVAARATRGGDARRCARHLQVTFAHDRWRGLADFVVRRPDGGYEALDTKLARHARPEHVLQLSFYRSRIQGRLPERMHVVNGLGEQESFRPDDYLAYYRRLRACFLTAVEHCGLCEFLRRCQAQWEADDHLTLVAGVSRAQVERLTAAGITTLTALGDAPPDTRVRKMRPATFANLRHQAELQLHRRRSGEHRVDLLPVEAERGFAVLPEPNPGDPLARPRAIRDSSRRAGSSTCSAGASSTSPVDSSSKPKPKRRAITEARTMADRGTTRVGFINPNGQMVVRPTGLPGTDHNQTIYVLRCTRHDCGYEYGANGSDIFERKCPACQGGRPGLPY